jgi:hypothetical protein
VCTRNGQLSDNDLTGTLDPLRGCVEMHTLILSGQTGDVGGLTGTFDALRGMAQLTILDLSANKFACDLEPLRACVDLRKCLISDNLSLGGSLEPLKGAKHIEKIDARSTAVRSTKADRKHFGSKLTCAPKPGA